MKGINSLVSLLLIVGLTYYSFYNLMPQKGTPTSVSETEFSTERALIPLKEITKAPHYAGSQEHERVRLFLMSQLKDLGLEVEEQIGYVLQENMALNKPKNILAKLKGSSNSKALLLLSHYDSAKVPSLGASDAGSGVVTILESLRAYIASGKTPKNDIIILFSDGEEIGLDGANLFVNKHQWAKNIGLVLNFEARGSGGPSNMILETNQGNANLVKAFVAANPEYPVASSLMYSIYKMLPNDTDSTVFREDGDIDSFFFAFIDDHYDYHTANDNFENLDRNTLQHQGSYLLPLLHHFADADLSNLKADEDYVYVNFPIVKMITYPFSWILPMLLIAGIIFIVLVFYGISKKRLSTRVIARGFLPLLSSLVSCGLLGYFGWELLLKIYPQYNEIQHGFTYNGHTYIAFFVFLSIAITFKIYDVFCKKGAVASFYIAPLLFWILINTALYIYLKGAGFFIIPVFFGLVSLLLLIKQERPNGLLLVLFAAPAIFIFAPLVQFFPVGLGLKFLVASCIFTVLLFGLLWPIFGYYKIKNTLFILCLIFAVGFFISAHFTSDFSEERQKPNSLIYYQDADKEVSYWVTYDKILDNWTKGYLGDSPEEASKYITNAAGSKYNTGYSYASEAPYKDIPPFEVLVTQDSVFENERNITFKIIPKRNVNQILVYVDTTFVFKNFKVNGLANKNTLAKTRTNKDILWNSVIDNDPVEISYAINMSSPSVAFTVLEYSYDLMKHPQFTINKRAKNMMPKPFVNTDAVVIKKTFKIEDFSVKKLDSTQTYKTSINE